MHTNTIQKACNNRSAKQINYTQCVREANWNGIDLRRAREEMGYGPSDMARLLRTPLRTYQDWEAVRRSFPAIVQVTMGLLAERELWVMQRAISAANQRIASDFPQGIKSEKEDE